MILLNFTKTPVKINVIIAVKLACNGVYMGNGENYENYEKCVKKLINIFLFEKSKYQFLKCRERKKKGDSFISKPVDLEVSFYRTGKSANSDDKQNMESIICIEVSSVNSTQLVGEITRLYYDKVWRKVLIVIYKAHEDCGNIKKSEAENVIKNLVPELYGCGDKKEFKNEHYPMKVWYLNCKKIKENAKSLSKIPDDRLNDLNCNQVEEIREEIRKVINSFKEEFEELEKILDELIPIKICK